MLEYIFFHEPPWSRFADAVRVRGLEPRCSADEAGFLIALPEDIEDRIAEELETLYDEMLDMSEQLCADQEGDAHVHLAGVTVTLADGRSVLAAVEPRLLARVMDALSPQEIGELVGAIVEAVERPDERPMCKR